MNVSRHLLALGVGLAVAPILNGIVRAADETPADSLAVQIRRQGHRCDGPLDAERDAKRSKPDMAVWVLKCTNATYRIQLIPHTAAHVELLK